MRNLSSNIYSEEEVERVLARRCTGEERVLEYTRYGWPVLRLSRQALGYQIGQYRVGDLDEIGLERWQGHRDLLGRHPVEEAPAGGYFVQEHPERPNVVGILETEGIRVPLKDRPREFGRAGLRRVVHRRRLDGHAALQVDPAERHPPSLIVDHDEVLRLEVVPHESDRV